MPSPYCQKRGQTWYLRLRAPADLRSVVGAQVIKSLGTGQAAEARSLAAAMVARAPMWWAVLRRMGMARILGKPIDHLTADDLTRSNLEALHADFDRLDAEARKELGAKLDALLKGAWLDVRASRDDLRVAELALDMMKDSQHRGRQEGLERALTLTGGRMASVDEAPQEHSAPAQKRGKSDPRSAMRLAALAEADNGFFADNPVGEKTKVSYMAAFEQFERMVGVRAVRNITEDDLLAYRKALEEQKGRDGRIKAATATVQKNLGHVKAILRWAHMPPQRLIASNPGRDVLGPKKAKGATTDGLRVAFNEQELKTIFSSPLYTGFRRPVWTEPGPHLEREDRFYFFLAMFLTGARNNELVGAGIYDLSGIPCLDLRATATKTKAAPRVVPLLPELIRTGFLRWAEDRIARGGKLFKGPRAIVKWTDWPSRYLREIGVGDQIRTAYSLRHSHRQMLRGSGLSDELIDKSFGHEGQKVGAGYGQGIMTRQEAEAWLKAVKCSVDLSHLYVK